ncbi:MAG: ABC transporter permease subunit [Actinomycetia bacterium]|nr:ABC transporter permease subunit [Actinomycetes bacterium]
MKAALSIYVRWMRDRRRSTIMWTLGMVLIIVATAAFYPSLSSATGESLEDSSGAMSSLLGLSAGIDPSTPLGFLWIGLYANIVPWVLMALGIALGSAAIAGDEESGALEYLLSRPITRNEVVAGRFAAAFTILLVVSLLSALSLVASIPLFDLADSVTTTALDGTTSTAPGATAGDVAAGTFAAFAVGLGTMGLAFLIGGISGRKGITLGASSAIAIAGYVLYTLSEMTGSLDFLTWVSPWRWYIDDAMLINGLSWDVLFPFGMAVVGLLVGWFAFLRRDLQNS